MLADPLAVKVLDTSVASAITVLSTLSFAVTDLSPGRSVRQGKNAVISANSPSHLTIAHSVSQENKPDKTDRLLVRYDQTCYSPSTLVPVTASAYLVVALPIGAKTDPVSDADPVTALPLVQTLLGALMVSPSAATISQANLIRMLAGEP